MTGLTFGFIALLLLGSGLRIWLGVRNIDFLAANGEPHSRDYATAREKVAMVGAALAAMLLYGWSLGGGFTMLDSSLRALNMSMFFSALMTLTAIVAISWVVGQSVSLYATLVIDQRFGLRRAPTLGILLGMAKRAALGLVVTIIAVAANLWLIGTQRPEWWLYTWLLWTLGGLARDIAYPVLIAPLFQRFRMLEASPLTERLAALAKRACVDLGGMRVTDTSQRTSRGNASFDGFGPAKRIVVSDTLIEALEDDEVEAVIAHEIGHYHHNHVVIRLVAVATTHLASLALLAWLAKAPHFNQALGIADATPLTTLFLFWLLLVAARPLARPFEATLLRHFEFEADRFAKNHCPPEALVSALKKLFQKNASAPCADPIYTTLLQGHPALSARIDRLMRTD